jgi:hypothetical protein
MQRSKLVQENIFRLALACLLLNGGMAFSLVSAPKGASSIVTLLTRLMFSGAGILASSVPFALWKIKNLDKYLERFGMKN